MVECRTPEREVGGSKPTTAVLCPWARHVTPRKYWLITQEAVAPSRHDWKIVDWDVKPQHKQTTEWCLENQPSSSNNVDTSSYNITEGCYENQPSSSNNADNQSSSSNNVDTSPSNIAEGW